MVQSPASEQVASRDAACKVAHLHLSVLDPASELGNLAKACCQRGIDQTSFFEWTRRFHTQGSNGLKDIPRIHKSHPQTPPPEVVEKIKALALAHPASGCKRHEAMRALEGVRVSSITIEKILNENRLGTKFDRWLALEPRNAEDPIEITSRQAAFAENLNPCFRERNMESKAPGELLSDAIFFVGTLKGVGNVYSNAAVGTFGFYGFRFQHVSKKPEAAVAFLHNDMMSFYRTVDLPAKAVPTDNGRGFCWTDRHPYGALPQPERHRAPPDQREVTENQRLRRALQRHRPRRVLPGEDARDLLRHRRSPPGRSRCLARPLQHRASASGLPQRRLAAHRNCHVIRQKIKISGQADADGILKE